MLRVSYSAGICCFELCKNGKKEKKIILLDLDYHNICRNLLPLMRWSREVRSKRRQNAFK